MVWITIGRVDDVVAGKVICVAFGIGWWTEKEIASVLERERLSLRWEARGMRLSVVHGMWWVQTLNN